MNVAGVRAFSLLEAALVLLIFLGLFSACAVTASTARAAVENARTEAQMARLERLLVTYYQAFGKLPCPADATRSLTDPQLGTEAQPPGACSGGMPSANMIDDDGAVAAGMVPFRALGLPFDRSVDGWSHRLMYAVATPLTIPGGKLPEEGGIAVRDLGGEARNGPFAFVLWSFGPDGHGAYPREGGLRRLKAAFGNPAQRENCDCDEDGATQHFRPLFVVRGGEAGPANQSYDDMVRPIEAAKLSAPDGDLDAEARP